MAASPRRCPRRALGPGRRSAVRRREARVDRGALAGDRRGGVLRRAVLLPRGDGRDAGQPGAVRGAVAHHWHWSNFRKVWDHAGFLTWYKNTLLYAVPVTLLTVVLLRPGGLRDGEVQLPLPQVRPILLVSAMMIPPQVTVMPMYILWTKQFGLGGTLWPLIIPTAFGDAYSSSCCASSCSPCPRSTWTRRRSTAAGNQDPAPGRGPDDPPGDRGGGAVPVLLRLERLLRPAGLSEHEPAEWTAGTGPGDLPRGAPRRLESDDGGQHDGHRAGGVSSSSPRRRSWRA